MLLKLYLLVQDSLKNIKRNSIIYVSPELSVVSRFMDEYQGVSIISIRINVYPPQHNHFYQVEI